ncbi:MAG TPA: TonB-dependent receptor [Rhodocyclaceae bacterium]
MKKMNKKTICWAALLALGVPSAFAAETLSGHDGDQNADFPVVLSASRLKQTATEAPSAVTVIDRTMIEASGARQIADLLRYVPGAVVGYNDGNWPVATLRGMSAVYASGVQVLIDGVSMYSPLWGGMLWSEIPITLDDIERIEVIRGPNAAVFGPNSFTGVINIITREPGAEKGSHLSANIGDSGVADVSYRHAGTFDNGLRYRATLAQRASNGFDTRPDSQRYVFGNLRAEYQIEPTQAVQLSARWGNDQKDLGDYDVRGGSMQPHTIFGRRFDLQLRWTQARSSDDELWVQYYHQQASTQDHVLIDLRDRFPFLPFSFPYNVEIDFATERDGVELQQTTRWNSTLRSVWGLEARRDAVYSPRLMGTEQTQSSTLTRGFGNFEWHFATPWTLHLAAMLERNSLASTDWSSRTALTYEPVTGHVLRVSSSTALRTPTLLEKKANYSFSAQLPAPFGTIVAPIYSATGKVDSESVRSDEIGYAFELPEHKFGGDMRWFVDHYRDLIGQSGLDYVNRDTARAEGGDLTLRWEPRSGTLLRLAAATTRIVSSDDLGHYSVSAPRQTLSLLWDQKIAPQTNFSANFQRVGKMAWLDAGENGRQLPAIDYLTLKLSQTLPMNSATGKLSLVVQNALGRHKEYYAGTSPLTVADRVAFIQYSMSY